MYLESQRRFDAALGAYKKAQDFGGIVRLSIMKNDMATAMQISLETGNPTACFHLA